jgi:pimeloyl-ACP methyl ester carboxylesterase
MNKLVHEHQFPVQGNGGGLNALQSVQCTGLGIDVAEVYAPVLIQFGEGDPMIGLHWPERWAKELPNNRLILIPRVKHFTFEGNPDATVENFLSWWAETFTTPKINAPLKIR